MIPLLFRPHIIVCYNLERKIYVEISWTFIVCEIYRDLTSLLRHSTGILCWELPFYDATDRRLSESVGHIDKLLRFGPYVNILL